MRGLGICNTGNGRNGSLGGELGSGGTAGNGGNGNRWGGYGWLGRRFDSLFPRACAPSPTREDNRERRLA